MNREEICHRLGIDETHLERLIAEGMPAHGEPPEEVFDEPEVATWLYRNGKAQIDRDEVSVTTAEAAERLGIHRRTLLDWCKKDGFPGRSGYYPIGAIRDWDAARTKKVNQYATIEEEQERPEKKEQLSIKEQRDLLKLEKERGELIEVDEVRRTLARGVSYAVSELGLIAGRVESRLPAGLDADLVRIIRDTIKTTVEEACTIVSEIYDEVNDGSDNRDS